MKAGADHDAPVSPTPPDPSVVAGSTHVDHNAIRDRVRSRAHRRRVRLLLAIPGLILYLALLAWAWSLEFAAIAGAGAVIFLAGHELFLRRREANAAKTDMDLLAYYRQDLDREIGRLRQAKALAPVLCAMVVITLIVYAITWISHGEGYLGFRKPLATMVTLAFAVALVWLDTRALPRLERERREST